MISKNLQKIKISRTKEDFWSNNCIKITNFQTTRDQKINTVYRWNRFKKINIKFNKAYSNIVTQNTSYSNTYSNSGKLPIDSKKFSMKSQANFHRKKISPIPKKNESSKNIVEPILKLKPNYNRDNKINVINLFKLSMMFNNINTDKNNNIEVKKPRIYSNRSSSFKRNKFSFLEENHSSKNKNAQKIKFKCTHDFNLFLNNDSLRQYKKKSENMPHIKNDITSIYKTSKFLNNVIDYLGGKLYKLRTQNNEKQFIKLKNESNREKLNEKILKIKEKRGEIGQDKIFFKKQYDTDEEEIINNKLKLRAKLNYRNGFSSNSFNSMKYKIFSNRILNKYKWTS